MPIKFADYSPTTLNEAVDILESSLNEEERSYISSKSTAGLHLGFGMHMRNEWGLWQNSELAQFFKDTYGLGHADDMSGLILESLKHRVTNTFHDIDSQVQSYKDHWKKYNVDPLTAENLDK